MSLLKLSNDAATNGLTWTWDNHNQLKTFIMNEAAKHKRTRLVFKNLQCVLSKYDNLFNDLSEVDDIEGLTYIIEQAKIEFSRKCNVIKPSVYLSGAAEETKYRASAISMYGHLFNMFDPITEHKQDSENLIQLDKEAIKECDIFVAYIKRYSAGTMMEISYAFSIGKPVYVIARGNFVKDIWINHHTTNFFPSIKTCFNYLIGEYKIVESEKQNRRKND